MSFNTRQYSSRSSDSAPTSDHKAWAQKNIVLKSSDPNFRTDIFSDVAEEAANRCFHKQFNKPAQARMFYDELVRWQSKVADSQSKFEELLPYIRMMRAKLAYAKGRQLINDAFYDIFSTCIDKVCDIESLKHCKLFFEAYLGFRKALGD